MEEEDDWNPNPQAESILKAKVITFDNQIIEENIEVYNSKPTPHPAMDPE